MAYNRRYILTITPINEKGEAKGKSIVIKDPLTIRFNVQRMPFMGSCCANIEIYNLQPKTRAQIFLDYFDFNNIQRVTLEAGYQNGKFDLIYRGRIVSCRARQEHTETIMTIEAQSGMYVLDSYISSSSKEGMYTSEMVNEVLANQSGFESAFIQPEAVQIPKPVALMGNEMAVLQTYTKGKVFIDNEKIISIDENSCIEGDVRVIDDETGLLGVPEREQVTLKVRCMFEPRIKVGQGLEIASKIAPEFDGQYKVWGVSHSGIIGLAASGQCITTIQLYTGVNIYGRFKTTYQEANEAFPMFSKVE